MFHFSQSKEPFNFLLCGGSGAGKSFLTHEIVRDFCSTSTEEEKCPPNRQESSHGEVKPKGKAQG